MEAKPLPKSQFGSSGVSLEFAVNDGEGVGEQAAPDINLGGGDQQGIIGRLAGDFGFNQLDAAGIVVFLEIGGGGEEFNLDRIGFVQRKFGRMIQRFAERGQRAVGQTRGQIASAPARAARADYPASAGGRARRGSTAWRDKPPCIKDHAVFETETRFVKRPVGVEHFTP